MASLIDKLRRAQPKKEHPGRPAAENCLIKVQQFGEDTCPPCQITQQAMYLLTGKHVEHDLGPEELLFLDTETTGLQGGAGTLAFLVGLGRFTPEGFEVRQYLMRDYDEERFVLDAVLPALAACRGVVSFNGASFDLPLLESRFIMNRMRLKDMPVHIDLLHIARRIYKLRLPRCTLVNLEAQVFGTPREDDLPGKDVPERYFRYLQSKDEGLLHDILRHNAQDIASLARLLSHLSALHLSPFMAADQRDLFSLGKVLEKRGQHESARVCFKACDAKGVQDMARWRLYDLMRRAGEHENAAGELERLRLSGRGGAKVFIALSKLYEHRFAQPVRALEIARQGMLYCLERLEGGGEDSPEYRDLAHRAKRLIGKTGGNVHGNAG